ncbi:unnamed protein product, partial [Laminaria digitata]
MVGKRARAALLLWARRAAASAARSTRLLRAARANQALVHASRMLSGKARRAVTRWFRFSANRRHFRRLLADRAIVPLPVNRLIPPPPSPPPSPPSPSWTNKVLYLRRRRPLERGSRLSVPSPPAPANPPIPLQNRYDYHHQNLSQNRELNRDQNLNNRKSAPVRSLLETRGRSGSGDVGGRGTAAA